MALTFCPTEVWCLPLYFSSAGAQFLPPPSPVIKPDQNRSLTFKYLLGSVEMFHSSALSFFLFLCSVEFKDISFL